MYVTRLMGRSESCRNQLIAIFDIFAIFDTFDTFHIFALGEQSHMGLPRTAQPTLTVSHLPSNFFDIFDRFDMFAIFDIFDFLGRRIGA